MLMHYDSFVNKLRLEAVRQDANVLRFVRNQTLEICIEAVRQNGYALSLVREQTKEICITAVMQTGDAIDYVIDQELKEEIKESLNI